MRKALHFDTIASIKINKRDSDYSATVRAIRNRLHVLDLRISQVTLGFASPAGRAGVRTTGAAYTIRRPFFIAASPAAEVLIRMAATRGFCLGADPFANAHGLRLLGSPFRLSLPLIVLGASAQTRRLDHYVTDLFSKTPCPSPFTGTTDWNASPRLGLTHLKFPIVARLR